MAAHNSLISEIRKNFLYKVGRSTLKLEIGKQDHHTPDEKHLYAFQKDELTLIVGASSRLSGRYESIL